MKTISQTPAIRLVAALAAGLVVGGTSALSVRADMYRWPDSIPVETEATNAIRGVPAAAIMNPAVVTPTNVTVSWYGMEGWSTVEASTNLTTWTPYAGVKATAHAWSSTLTNTFGGSANFRVAQTNYYAGSGDCAGCHGDVYNSYATTAHAGALASLQNIHMDKPSCTPCHTVGMGQPTGFISSTATPQLANVGCESCHGPAGWHRSSDHYGIHPAISIDPAICGSCHQDTHHPTYEEYSESLHAQVNLDIKYGNAAATNYYTNTVIIGTNVYYGYYVTPNGASFKTNATTGIINSSHVPGSPVDPGQSRAAQCGVCHSAATRFAMLQEYNDNLAGNPHTIDFPAATDLGAWSATCATCHDPHSTNYNAQLRHPTWSTNFYTMPTTTDTYLGTRKATNALGYVQTETLYKNTTFDSSYNPSIQICGQCHNSRGATWDGRAYGLITNSVVTVSTNVVRSNILVLGRWTAVLVTNVVTSTNYPVVVGLTTPLIAYTNGGVVYYTTNSSGYGRPPHHSPQYNILVGKPDTNFYMTASIHSHGGTGNPGQCSTCHTASYAVSSTTNVTGHTFEISFKDAQCISCHSGLSDEAFELKIEDLQYQESNNIVRIVGLLNQWATNVAPGLLRTNYGANAWEYTTPGALAASTKSGPPSAYNARFGAQPSGTNDNLQLQIPVNIRKARFNIYMVLHDGSYGVHNPTFTKNMLTNAEMSVITEFAAAGYSAAFSVFPVGYTALYTTYVGTNIVFTNLTATTGGKWNFGDGTITNVVGTSVKYAYSAAGLYTVSYTDTNSGAVMTRNAYIKVREYPALQFAADATSGLAPFTATFTNTSTGISTVDWWRWSMGSTRVETTDDVVSYTFTTPGSNNISLRANLSGGGNVSTTKTNYIIVNGINFSGTPTNKVVPMSVVFTNKSVGMSNFVWNFGNGTTSTAANPTCIYTNAGTYSVMLSADYNGTTYSMTQTNYITANPAPVAAFSTMTTNGAAPLTVWFYNTSINADRFAWSFGDGNTSTNINPSNVYTNAGTYSVTLKAINSALSTTNTLTQTNYVTVQ